MAREAKQRGKIEKKTAKQKPPKQKAIITVPLTEGPEYRVGEITVSGNTVMPSSALRSLIPLQEGQVFDSEALKGGLDSIESLYGQQATL